MISKSTLYKEWRKKTNNQVIATQKKNSSNTKTIRNNQYKSSQKYFKQDLGDRIELEKDFIEVLEQIHKGVIECPGIDLSEMEKDDRKLFNTILEGHSSVGRNDFTREAGVVRSSSEGKKCSQYFGSASNNAQRCRNCAEFKKKLTRLIRSNREYILIEGKSEEELEITMEKIADQKMGKNQGKLELGIINDRILKGADEIWKNKMDIMNEIISENNNFISTLRSEIKKAELEMNEYKKEVEELMREKESCGNDAPFVIKGDSAEELMDAVLKIMEKGCEGKILPPGFTPVSCTLMRNTINSWKKTMGNKSKNSFFII